MALFRAFLLKRIYSLVPSIAWRSLAWWILQKAALVGECTVPCSLLVLFCHDLSGERKGASIFTLSSRTVESDELMSLALPEGCWGAGSEAPSLWGLGGLWCLEVTWSTNGAVSGTLRSGKECLSTDLGTLATRSLSNYFCSPRFPPLHFAEVSLLGCSRPGY